MFLLVFNGYVYTLYALLLLMPLSACDWYIPHCPLESTREPSDIADSDKFARVSWRLNTQRGTLRNVSHDCAEVVDIFLSFSYS